MEKSKQSVLLVQQHNRLSKAYLLCYLVNLGSTSTCCEHGLELNQSVCHYDFHDWCLENQHLFPP